MLSTDQRQYLCLRIRDIDSCVDQGETDPV